MVVAFYFRLHLAYFPRPVVAIFARPEQFKCITSLLRAESKTQHPALSGCCVKLTAKNGTTKGDAILRSLSICL